MPTATITREYVRKFRDDYGFFCQSVGHPRTSFQLDAMRLDCRQTVVVAPRQCGKSESLSLLALWWAFRQSNQLVMVVSASETAAVRLLGTIRDFCTHPLLKDAVVDETMTRLVLSNGSRILSMPASEKAIRGWSVDLLIVDEAAFIPDDILLSAALPTTTARPDARIVLSSTPWGDAGAFYTMAMTGFDKAVTHTQTFQWRLLDAPWITQATIETARNTLPPLRFRAEYEGEFVISGDAYFSREDILACTADYPLVTEGHGMPVKCGLDWGRQQDAHAIALLGVADDYGVNGEPIVVVPYIETSRRPYAAQVDEVVRLARDWDMEVATETNGVGAYPSEEVQQRVGGWTRVVMQASTQKSKEDAYGRLLARFQARRIVIPRDPELLRQLGGITATATGTGGLRIEARTEGLHDDIPDAMAAAVAMLPRELEPVSPSDVPEGAEWAETSGGVKIPVPIRTRFAEPDWGTVYTTAVATPGPNGTSVAVDPPNPWLAVYGKREQTTADRLRALKGMES